MLESEMTKRREYFVSEPPSTANASVIWLHGLGADGKDFAGIVEQLGLPLNHGVRFIFPSAPFMNITVNQGMLMRGWYDIYDLQMLNKEDEQGIKQSMQQISEFINHEQASGIAAQRIILAGFSQGGAMALYTALNSHATLGGVLALSAYLPLMQSLKLLDKHQSMPIFMAHGLFDPVVPYNLGVIAQKFLEQHAYNVEWQAYPMQHTLCLEEIAAIGVFLRRVLDYA